MYVSADCFYTFYAFSLDKPSQYPNQRNLRPIRNDVSSLTKDWKKNSQEESKLVQLNIINIKLKYNITQICIKFVYFNACQNQIQIGIKPIDLLNLDAFWTKSLILSSFSKVDKFY